MATKLFRFQNPINKAYLFIFNIPESLTGIPMKVQLKIQVIYEASCSQMQQ